jgi:radical SAM superfamily enzyme YgiQ (UPF0313 family)
MTVTVGLVQINNGFSGQYYLPYAAGLLQAYALRHSVTPGRYRFLPPLYRRIHRDAAVEALDAADVVGFSTYVWNANISAEVAKSLKERRPDCLVVMGGPNVPTRAEAFLRANRQIDVVVHDAGEAPFLALLDAWPNRDWDRIAGISWLDKTGTFRHNPPAERLRDLAPIPSPYLDGVFEPLMAAEPGQTWLALWETNRGCPYSCTYCDWGSAVAAKIATFPMERVLGELEWMARHRIEFVFCADANFGILPRDVDIARHAAALKGATGYPRALSVQNTKNVTERAYQSQKILTDAGLSKGVTISVQTLDRTALANIRRQNISTEGFELLQRRFVAENVVTYTDYILGLPGETADGFMDAVAHLIANGQHNRIQFNNLSILPNAEMADPDYRRRHGLLTVPAPIVNIHGTLEVPEDGIAEEQLLVVGTASLPPDDWRRVRVYAFIAGLLYFDKLLQLPLMVLNREAGIGFRQLFESFAAPDPARFPRLAAIAAFFESEARRVQAGGAEMVYSSEWLGIFWPADEYVFVELAVTGQLQEFYAEAAALLAGMAADSGVAAAVEDAVRLNHLLLKLPDRADDVDVGLSHDLPGFYTRMLHGEDARLECRPTTYRVLRSGETWADWPTWMREVVWYGHRKGAYLHGGATIGTAIAGHY